MLSVSDAYHEYQLFHLSHAALALITHPRRRLFSLATRSTLSSAPDLHGVTGSSALAVTPLSTSPWCPPSLIMLDAAHFPLSHALIASALTSLHCFFPPFSPLSADSTPGGMSPLMSAQASGSWWDCSSMGAWRQSVGGRHRHCDLAGPGKKPVMGVGERGWGLHEGLWLGRQV